MTPADALQRSRDAHDRYREALPRRVSNGNGGTVVIQGDAIVAGDELVTACKWRAEAHQLDPGQSDPAWTDEAATHDHSALLDFYVKQLTLEPAAVKAVTAVFQPEGIVLDVPAVAQAPLTP